MFIIILPVPPDGITSSGYKTNVQINYFPSMITNLAKQINLLVLENVKF